MSSDQQTQKTPAFEGPFDNAFELYGDDTRAANLKVRVRLMDHLNDYIQDRDLTQEEAAECFGVPQSRISFLVNGRIHKFTIDYLINMCSQAGIEVDLQFAKVNPE